MINFGGSRKKWSQFSGQYMLESQVITSGQLPKFPTELTSFSIFNMPALVNNPYGQFVPSLWRGSEDRHMLELHVRKLL